MIKTKNGKTEASGDYGDILADISCIVASINLKTDIPAELILEAAEDGLELSEKIMNGENIDEFFKKSEQGD